MDDKFVMELLLCEELFDKENISPPKPSWEDFEGYDLNRWLFVKSKVEKYGLEWCIAAVIDGSIGYHTYHSAKNLVMAVLEQNFYYCERTGACYRGDASYELASDIFRFEGLMKLHPEKAERIIEFVRHLEKLNWEQSMTISMLYPTLNI